MTAEQLMVKEFHEAFDIKIAKTPTIPDNDTIKLRINLIKEELEELEEALYAGDIVESADAIADLLYVVYGCGVAIGIDCDPVFREVHRSNMTKVGGYKREDGKWMKPSSYEPPNLLPLIQQMNLG